MMRIIEFKNTNGTEIGEYCTDRTDEYVEKDLNTLYDEWLALPNDEIISPERYIEERGRGYRIFNLKKEEMYRKY